MTDKEIGLGLEIESIVYYAEGTVRIGTEKEPSRDESTGEYYRKGIYTLRSGVAVPNRENGVSHLWQVELFNDEAEQVYQGLHNLTDAIRLLTDWTGEP
jgi:hypothetical protein